MKFAKRLLMLFLLLCISFPPAPTFAAGSSSGAFSMSSASIAPTGGFVTVDVTAPSDSLLIAALYPDDGTTMLGSTQITVTASSDPQVIRLPIPKHKSNHGEIRLFLLDPKTYAPLCPGNSVDYCAWMTLDDVAQPTTQTVAYDTQEKIYYITDTLLVFFEPDTSAAAINGIIDELQGEVIGRDEQINLFQIRITASTLEELTAISSKLMTDYSCVSYASYDTVIPNSENSLGIAYTNDPWNGDVDSMDWYDHTAEGSNWWVEAVNGQHAWSIIDQFDEIDIGIIDNSFDPGHEDLKNQVEFADALMASRNDTTPWYADSDNETWGAADQYNAHGTHVAGIVGAEANNSKGIAGVAHHANLLLAPAPALNNAQIFSGLSHVVRAGAKVVNMSIGTTGNLTESNPYFSKESLFRSATMSAISMTRLLEEGHDFIMVQSAGNGRKDEIPTDAINNAWFCSITDETPTASNTISIQDLRDHIIIVGAAEQTSTGYQCCSFSNFGEQVSICAPGRNVYSTLPGNLVGFEFTGGYGNMSGTSMATPIVTAICALTWSVNEDLNAAQVRELVCSATDQIVEPHPDSDSDMRYHMVNAKLAMEAALEYTEDKIPVTVTVKDGEGNPVKGAAITINDNPTYTGKNITTRMDGTAMFFLEEGSYYISVTSGEYYAAQRLDLTEKTELELRLKKTYFTWEVDESGTHLTVNGYGPMPAKPYDATQWWPETITSAEINGVDSICAQAFSNCDSLAEVTLDDTIYNIRSSAFSSCDNLTGIELPDELFRFEAEAFQYCTTLAEITIPGKINHFGSRIFYACTGLTKAVFEEGIHTIPYEVFSGCTALTDVTIPDGVTVIGTGAFSHCSSLSSISIPNSVTTLEGGAFDYTGLISPTLPDSITTLGNAVFRGCSSLTGITIPGSVTSVGGNMFEGCSSLSVVSLPDNLTEIPGNMFQLCTGLTSIHIPDSVTSIGIQAFSGSGLTTVTIPNRVASIGDDAFQNCDGLTTISIPGSVTAIGHDAFSLCDNLTTASLPGSITTLGYDLFENCIELTHVTLGPGIASISNRMFYGCKKLTSVTMPSSVTSIGESAFYGCAELESISLSSGLTKISTYAFRNCSKLANVLLPSSLTSIGSYAFDNCDALTSISIPSGITAINNYTFNSCGKLVSVSIPITVTTIGNGAFNGCSKLTDVYYGGSSAQWEAVTIGSSNTRITKYATVHYSA